MSESDDMQSPWIPSSIGWVNGSRNRQLTSMPPCIDCWWTCVSSSRLPVAGGSDRVARVAGGGQEEAQAELELALEEGEDAVELGAIEAQAGLELAAQALDQGAPGAREPAGGGGAVNAVEGGDAVDAEAVDDV